MLTTNQVITGDVSLDERNQVLLHRKDDQFVDVYPAHQLVSIFLFDSSQNINRRFFTKCEEHICKLVEIVVAGEITVSRIKTVALTNPENTDRDGYDYYFEHNRTTYRLHQFRTKVYPMVRDVADIAEFVRSQGLNPNSPSDAIIIIRQYNLIRREEEALATQR